MTCLRPNQLGMRVYLLRTISKSLTYSTLPNLPLSLRALTLRCGPRDANELTTLLAGATAFRNMAAAGKAHSCCRVTRRVTESHCLGLKDVSQSQQPLPAAMF